MYTYRPLLEHIRTFEALPPLEQCLSQPRQNLPQSAQIRAAETESFGHRWSEKVAPKSWFAFLFLHINKGSSFIHAHKLQKQGNTVNKAEQQHLPLRAFARTVPFRYSVGIHTAVNLPSVLIHHSLAPIWRVKSCCSYAPDLEIWGDGGGEEWLEECCPIVGYFGGATVPPFPQSCHSYSSACKSTFGIHSGFFSAGLGPHLTYLNLAI